jgi:Zinc dependent phospholipase C
LPAPRIRKAQAAGKVRAREATPRARPKLLHRRHHTARLLGAISIALLCGVAPARAWDSATHRAITRLAVEALPPSPLKSALSHNEAALEVHAVDPDTVLKAAYGKAEARRHYVDLEQFGPDPWPALNPDIKQMQTRFGESTVERAGTLPWTIEDVSDQLQSAWRRSDCEAVVRLSGYLAHYLGDASQPLHSTVKYDGDPGDRGIHARIEVAVDDSIGELEPVAAREVRIEDINNVWTPSIAEIRDANGLIGELTRDDRAARSAAGHDKSEYQRALMHEDAAMFARQIAGAASVLASVWLFEWHRAGSPPSCAGQ